VISARQGRWPSPSLHPFTLHQKMTDRKHEREEGKMMMDDEREDHFLFLVIPFRGSCVVCLLLFFCSSSLVVHCVSLIDHG